MSKHTEQRELDRLADQLKKLGELKRDKGASAATYREITGKSLNRWGGFGVLRPVLAVILFALIVTPLAVSQHVGGLFGKPSPTPTATPTSANASATVETEPAAVNAEANVNISPPKTNQNPNNVIPSVPAVPKQPLIQDVQNTVDGVLGKLGL